MAHYFNKIYGYFDFADIYTHALNQFPNGRFIEIGSWLGKSTCFMAETIKENNFNTKFYTVDTFLGEINATDQQEIVQKEGGNIYNRFLHNMKEAEVIDYVTPLMTTSEEASKLFDDKSFDFIFIDAEHLYEFVKQDLNNWYPKLKDGGIFAGHDYREGVKKAVDEYFQSRQVQAIGSSWMIVK
jgi:predicted O-methyltransferase YrrM